MLTKERSANSHKVDLKRVADQRERSTASPPRRPHDDVRANDSEAPGSDHAETTSKSISDEWLTKKRKIDGVAVAPLT